MNSKFDKLKNYLNKLKKHGICHAFSGGIDSTLLLHLCSDMNILAITFNSDLQTQNEIELTKNLCKNTMLNRLLLRKIFFKIR